MTGPATAAASTRDSGVAIRHQLDRMVASHTFQQADRLKRFLRFIVEETLDGRGHALKEYVVAVQVFGKEDSFDPRTDPLVRVQARRLRARLARYYREEGQSDELLIDLPKGGYSPIFKPREPGAHAKRSVATALVSGNNVAVLSFADHSAGGDLAYFCKGLREEIIQRLARLEGLRILAADAGDPARDRDPRDIAERVNAAVIIDGSVRSSGQQVRVTVHLIDGASGCYVWSESVDTTLVDPFAAQEQVANAVVAKLQPELSRSGGSRMARRSSENLAAHNLYLQGRYQLNQRTEEGLQKALELFERALVEDAQYALAHSGLSDAYSLLAHYGVRRPAEVWARTASSAATAVMLDDHSAEAHTSLAHAKSTQDWDWTGAQREFQRAIALDPRYPTAHHWYAMSCLVPMGRLDDALEEIRLARALDPVSSIISREVASMHYYRREFDTALEQCDQTIELNPHFSPAYWSLGLIQEQRREFDESIAAFQRAVQLSPQSPRMQAALARALAISGKRQMAMKFVRSLNELVKHRYVSPAELALVHCALKQEDVGFELLEKACDDRSFELLSINVDPRWDSIRKDPRSASVVERVGVA